MMLKFSDSDMKFNIKKMKISSINVKVQGILLRNFVNGRKIHFLNIKFYEGNIGLNNTILFEIQRVLSWFIVTSNLSLYWTRTITQTGIEFYVALTAMHC